MTVMHCSSLISVSIFKIEFIFSDLIYVLPVQKSAKLYIRSIWLLSYCNDCTGTQTITSIDLTHQLLYIFHISIRVLHRKKATSMLSFWISPYISSSSYLFQRSNPSSQQSLPLSFRSLSISCYNFHFRAHVLLSQLRFSLK